MRMAGGEAGFHEGAEEAHTWRSGLNSGKLDRQVQPHQPPTQLPACPECGSQRIWKDGVRCTNRGEVQRYICRACGYRFSETTWNNSDEHEHVERVHTTSFYSDPALPINRQVCVTETQGAKNLAEVESRIEKWAAGATKPSEADVKGKIVEFAWWLKKEGYAESTATLYVKLLDFLARLGTDIFNPDSVKETMARQKWGSAVKHNVISAYTTFLKMLGQKWEKPMLEVTRKLPFIPTEQEIDALIAGCGKKTATLLQLLKETAMRSGEAERLLWTDVDFERRIITLNEPEKRGNPRMFNVSVKLIDMLSALPKTSKRVFGDVTPDSHKGAFYWSKKRLAQKLQNPRLMQVHFHTLRHWKATMLYHQTKDPFYVKEFLGHKRLDTTQLYIQIEKALFKEMSDEFTVNVASEPEEIKKLLEVGFEYICEKDGLMFFRKRK